MVRIAIVEDEQISQLLLQKYINEYATDYGETFDVSVFSDGKEIVQNYKPYYDIILLDVKMKDMDGYSAAKHIRKVDDDVILIFITNMVQYAIKGYQVNAMSYLLKPVSYFAFSQELKRSLKHLKKNNKSFLTLPVEQGVLRLDIEKIYYIDREKHCVLIHTAEDVYPMVGTMKDMEAELEGKHFFRCNSGYLVNLAQVRGVQDSLALVGEYEIPVSRPKRKAFMTALTDYWGGTKK